tara:strand:- start:1642 stop:1959 length:318 start_codon:yes stop_codon:yes gene_type:complete
MSWESILKRRSYCLEGVARDLFKLDLKYFYYWLQNATPYDKQMVSGELDEKQLMEIVMDSIGEIARYRDKGRIDNQRYIELTEEYEKIIDDIKNCKDVKNWDDGK